MTVPGYLRHFVNNTSLYPPRSLPLPAAVATHREHLSAAYADLVGPFVVSDLHLPDLYEVIDDAVEPLRVVVVVTGGAGAIEPAVRWATRSGLLDVTALQTPLRDEDDLGRNAQRIVAAVDSVRDLLGETPVYVEPPRFHGTPGAGWLRALDELAAAELRLKFRTGGVDRDQRPEADELATAIDEALDRELPFTCTGGLGQALASADQHGFLNILIATGAAFEGAGTAEVAELLTSSFDVATLSGAADDLQRARRWFTSFGCPDGEGPARDLAAAGLLET